MSGLGQLNRPYIPDIPGLAEFEGTTFHSARWDHDHDLRGERVGVIGIGASAIQFVPRIAREARQLTLFQRSANYVGPKPRPTVPPASRSWRSRTCRSSNGPTGSGSTGATRRGSPCSARTAGSGAYFQKMFAEAAPAR